MATESEWIAGIDRHGQPLDVVTANKFRLKAGKAPLPVPEAKTSKKKNNSKVVKIIRKPKGPGFGPGTEYKKLATTFGIKPKADCKCTTLCVEMDMLGVIGCRNLRPRLIERLQENYETLGILDKVLAVFNGGLPPWLSLLDPVASMFDEAVRLAVQQVGLNESKT